MTNSVQEWVDLVDDQDRVLGQVTRAEMRSKNLWHRTIAVMCLNSSGHIYVHRRTDTKDLFPGMHDVFVGGVVAAGESYAACAKRELGEELGVIGPEPVHLFTFRYDGSETRSHTAVYRVIWDGAIHHQASEVSWGAFMPIEEIILNSRGWTFVPDGYAVFQHYLATWHNIASR